jgi:hypothetical protein
MGGLCSRREVGDVSRAFDPGDPSQRRYTAYGLAEFPDPRDVEIDEYIAGVKAGGPAEVQSALAAVSDKGRQVLRSYAERSASRAVRSKDPDNLVLGLIALVVGGLDQNTLESLMRMPLIEDAGRRLGIEPADLFEEVAGIVGHPGSVNLMLWLTRAPEDRTPECMGFEAAQDDSGFRYRWTA